MLISRNAEKLSAHEYQDNEFVWWAVLTKPYVDILKKFQHYL